MSDPADNSPDRLIARSLDGLLADADHDALLAALDSDDDLRQAYVQMTILDSLLTSEHRSAEHLGGILDELTQVEQPAETRFRRAWNAIYDVASNYITLSLLIASITMAIIVLSMGLIRPDGKQGGNAEPLIEFVAEITSTYQSRWSIASDANLKNRSLFVGDRLVLDEGLAEVTFNSGAKAILEGPATFEILGRKSGYLQVGSLVARIEQAGAQGFSIDTPQAHVVDLSTEFGVKVEANGRTTASVLSGEIVFYQRTDDGVHETGLKLVKGESAIAGGDLSSVVRMPNMTNFVRTMPTRGGPSRSSVPESARLVSVDFNQELRPSQELTQTAVQIWRGDLADPENSGDQVGVWHNGAAAANWWNCVSGANTPVSPASGQLFDADGRATTVTVSLVNTGGAHAHNWTDSTDDHLASDGYYGAVNGGSISMTIGGLSPGQTYDLILYHADDHPSETVDVNGHSANDYELDLVESGYSDAFDGIDGADFWYFSKVVADEQGELKVSASGAGYQTICGFQLLESVEYTKTR